MTNPEVIERTILRPYADQIVQGFRLRGCEAKTLYTEWDRLTETGHISINVRVPLPALFVEVCIADGFLQERDDGS